MGNYIKNSFEQNLNESHLKIHQYILENFSKYISGIEGRIIFLTKKSLFKAIERKFGGESGGFSIYQWLGENYGDDEKQFMIVNHKGSRYTFKGDEVHSWGMRHQ